MNLQNIEPQNVWKWFQFICDTPHQSNHEQLLIDKITNWAKAKNLEVLSDDINNLLIRKKATLGYENKEKVILQAHLDMVAQKNKETKHDFLKDSIVPYIDGGWVKAKGTTLGADNGIGMAACLAILDSDDIKHPNLEVLFTITEEAGMKGAFALKSNWLTGDILINTDSEEEGEVFVGCAGGIDYVSSLEIERTTNKFNCAYEISIEGLLGGHSGCDIHLNRGNSILLLSELLVGLPIPYELATFSGGNMRNAIPRESSCIVQIDDNNFDSLEKYIKSFETKIKTKHVVEKNAKVSLLKTEVSSKVFSEETKGKLLDYLANTPNAVAAMSNDFVGVVETSSSLGIASIDGNQIQFSYLIRSLIDDGKQQIVNSLNSLAAKYGFLGKAYSSYPGWKPNKNSEILKLFVERYKKTYNKEPKVNVIHAGLECGLFQKPYPNLDMLSFGPTIKNPHSPDEKVNIKSVELFWQQLVDLLENIPEKTQAN